MTSFLLLLICIEKKLKDIANNSDKAREPTIDGLIVEKAGVEKSKKSGRRMEVEILNGFVKVGIKV